MGDPRPQCSDGLEEEREAGIFWDKVVEVPFGVVSGGWCWVGGFGRGVFMMGFHLMACVFWWRIAKRTQALHGVIHCDCGALWDVIELNVRQVCDLMSVVCETFLRRSKYGVHMEGMWLWVTGIIGQEYMVVVRLYTDTWARVVGFGLSRESWMVLKRRLRLRY